MVKTNIQTFTGEVEILSNLHLGDGSYYLTANADASNVVEVTGNVGATFSWVTVDFFQISRQHSVIL